MQRESWRSNSFLARSVFPAMLVVAFVAVCVLAVRTAHATKVHPLGVIGIAAGFLVVRLAEWQRTLTYREFSREEVARHCTPQSCWLVVNGDVFDVTDFLHKHPPGAHKILAHAGEDATRHYAFHLESTKHFWRQLKIGWVGDAAAP